MKQFTRGFAGIALLGLGFPAGVSAETVYTWTGGGGADVNWTTPANWDVAAYPDGDEDVVVFTNAANLLLDADVTVKRCDLRGGGATVTIEGTNTITVSPTDYRGIGALDVNDRLVIYPKVVKAAGTNPNDRLYCNTDITKLGTVVFRNTVLIRDLSAAFAVNNGTLELSGDAAVSTVSESYTFARLFMGMLAPAGAQVRFLLNERASLKLATLDLASKEYNSGHVCQDGTGTAVSASQALMIGQSLLFPATGTSASPRSSYTLNNGSLTAGTLYCGYRMPGLFLMTNGTLTAQKIIVGTAVSNCEFRMTGGHLYPGSGGISLSNSASLLLGGGTVHVTNAAWASDAALTLTGEGGDTVFQTEGNAATLSGTLSGAGGLVKRGAGTLTFAGRVAFKGRLEVAEGAVTFGPLSTIDGMAELLATNGTVAFANSSGLEAPPYYFDTLRVTTGKLALGAGCFLYVANYIVDGAAQPLGSYTVGSGRVKVVNFWTGAGGDANWTTPGNWGGGGCPTGLTSIACFTNSANVTLDRDVIVGRTILNGGGSTVTLSGAGRIYTVGQNVDSNYKSFLSRDVNDRLVVQTEVRMYSATGPHERLYCNATPYYRGAVAFQGRVKINNVNAYVFVSGGNQTEFSGDADVRPDATGSSGITLGMIPLAGGDITCRVLDNASLRVNTLEMSYSRQASGSVVQEGPNTSVSVVQALYMGTVSASTANYIQSYYLNNGGLSAGTLYCGHNLPGRFLMTNGTLTATSVILGRGTAHACSFSMTGGNAYLGGGGIAYSNSASMTYLGGGTVHATAPWSSSAALNLTGEGGNTVFDTAGYAVTLGALDGAGGLVKTGTGTLTLGGANVFTGGVTVAGGTLAAGSGLANATNLSVTASGAVLSLGSADSLNTNATLALSAGGCVNLNFSGAATVGALVVNGTEKSPGTYGSGSPFITGAGVLRVLTGPAPQGTLFSIL